MATEWAECRNLIILAGHAIFTGGARCDPGSAADDSNWVLQAFQSGEGKYYIAHLRRAIELAREDARSLLVLSGGQTRAGTHLTEACSYYDLALAHDAEFSFSGDVRARTTTEDYARDSYENVLFSIARFHECVNAYPHKITLISWKFKRPRLLLHARTIRWPMNRLVYEGVFDPEDLAAAIRSGQKTLAAFQEDPSGCGEVLGAKRAARNPYNRYHPYAVSCPSMADMLAWDGKSRVPLTLVPWAVDSDGDGDAHDSRAVE